MGALWEAEGDFESCKMGSSQPQSVFTDQATVACLGVRLSQYPSITTDHVRNTSVHGATVHLFADANPLFALTGEPTNQP